MPTLRDIIAKGLSTVFPYTEKQENVYTMTEKGISAGREVGSESNSMAIFQPGGSNGRISADKAMARNYGWTYAAVRAIADEIANIEWRQFLIKTNDDEEEQFDSPLLDLLNGVNDHQTGVEFKHLLAAHLEFTGNAYILLLGADGKPVQSYEEKPSSMTLLNPARCTVLVDKSSYPYTVVGYKFTVDGKSYAYSSYQVVHLKYPDPSNQIQGIGTVQAISDWIDTDDFIMFSNRKNFENGARPGGTLKTPYKTEVQLSRAVTSFDQNYSGAQNAGKTVALPNGVEFKDSGLTNRDMDYANLMDKMEDRILAGFRVSKTVLGAAESETSRATAETSDYVFAKRTIKPKMVLITSYLNEFLVPRFGDDIYLSFDDPVPDDKTGRMEELKTTTGSQPVLTVNEARQEYLGLGPIDGGDSVMVSGQMITLGGSAMDMTGKSKAIEGDEDLVPAIRRSKKSAVKALYFIKGGKVKTRFAQNAKVRNELSKTFLANIEKHLAAQRETISTKGLTELSHDEYMPIWKDFVGRVSKYEDKLREGFVDLNAKQQEEVLKNLESAIASAKGVDVKDLFNIGSWISLTIDFVTPIVTALSKTEATAAANLIGKPEAANVFDTEEHRNALDKAVSLMSQSYNETTLNLLKAQLDQGIQAGESLFDLTDRVKGVYDFSDERRAALIARTESYRIANDTTKETWKASGVVSTIKWYTAEDGRVCAFCEDQDGKVVSIDDNFFNKGDTLTVDGSDLSLDYTDVGAPPLHGDCRCYVRPEDISI
jgi:HK97 family phage portal protein